MLGAPEAVICTRAVRETPASQQSGPSPLSLGWDCASVLAFAPAIPAAVPVSSSSVAVAITAGISTSGISIPAAVASRVTPASVAAARISIAWIPAAGIPTPAISWIATCVAATSRVATGISGASALKGCCELFNVHSNGQPKLHEGEHDAYRQQRACDSVLDDGEPEDSSEAGRLTVPHA